MDLLEWAQNEVRIASERERANAPDDEWDYGVACYESALKAFKSLTEDGHSGFSIQITKNILMRLIDHLCLTPIDDTDDVWNEVDYNEFDNSHTYQCKRMSSLFKDVYSDGTVKYSDVDRNYCKNIMTGSTYGFNMASHILDEIFPITMPYMPDTKNYVLYVEDFQYDNVSHSDFDTFALYSVLTPKGINVRIDRYYKDGVDGMVEISAAEYLERRNAYYERRLKEENK